MKFPHKHTVGQFGGLVSIKMRSGGCNWVSRVKIVRGVAIRFQGSNWAPEVTFGFQRPKWASEFAFGFQRSKLAQSAVFGYLGLDLIPEVAIAFQLSIFFPEDALFVRASNLHRSRSRPAHVVIWADLGQD